MLRVYLKFASGHNIYNCITLSWRLFDKTGGRSGAFIYEVAEAFSDLEDIHP